MNFHLQFAPKISGQNLWELVWEYVWELGYLYKVY